MLNIGTSLSFILLIACVVLVVSWVAVPFFIFGMKKLLERILGQLVVLNESREGKRGS